MNAPSDTIHGSPTFHTVIEKQADGTFVGRIPAMPQITPQIGRSESEAILKVRTQVEAHIGGGGR